MVTVEEARKILGENGQKYSDDELQQVLETFYGLADLILELQREQKAEGSKNLDNILQHETR